MKEAATIAHDNAPSLTPLVTLLADDMEQVNAQIVARMASDVPLVPELAGQLQSRKVTNINKAEADIVAAGNLGCINQISGVEAPVCHTVQLLDWAYGGPIPAGLEGVADKGK